jgi:N-acyl amino acid synthase of PEP-CTERM/exosortase system
MMGMGDLFGYYYQHFAVLRANTPRLLDQVYRLRYQVYCIENQFEDPNEHLDGREMDEHDAVSAHILLLHRKSGTPVGTARIIMPQLESNWRPLPVWHVLTPEGREEFERLLPLPRTAEVSRFAVSKEFRRWWRNHHGPTVETTHQHTASGELQLMQYVTFGLIQDILQLGLEKRVDYLVAAMNSSLMRIFVNLGLELEPIGRPVEYHGLRQPCVLFLANILEESQSLSTPFWRFIGFRDAYLRAPFTSGSDSGGAVF